MGKPLPFPFEDIRFNWDVSDGYVRLEYTGVPARLIECGAIEPHMAEKTKGPKPRFDSAGHYFKREKRLIMRDPVSAGLHIARYITDPKFAETLPGGPRGLRFKRLDWLDAHPGELHEYVEEEIGRKRLAGTVANLVSIGGFPEKIFRANTLRMILYAPHYAEVRSLMRGYFEILLNIERQSTKPPAAPPPRQHLRLVVDNDVVSA